MHVWFNERNAKVEKIEGRATRAVHKPLAFRLSRFPASQCKRCLQLHLFCSAATTLRALALSSASAFRLRSAAAFRNIRENRVPFTRFVR